MKMNLIKQALSIKIIANKENYLIILNLKILKIIKKIIVFQN